MVSPARRRAAVVYLVRRHGISERRACALIGQHRSTQRYRALVPLEEAALVRAMNARAARNTASAAAISPASTAGPGIQQRTTPDAVTPKPHAPNDEGRKPRMDAEFVNRSAVRVCPSAILRDFLTHDPAISLADSNC